MSDQTCAKCRSIFSAGIRAGQPALVCRRLPPQTHFIVVLREAPAAMVLKGGPQMMPVEEQRSAFPAVMADWSCGEWAPAAALMS